MSGNTSYNRTMMKEGGRAVKQNRKRCEAASSCRTPMLAYGGSTWMLEALIGEDNFDGFITQC